jgi:hypothetical protein
MYIRYKSLTINHLRIRPNLSSIIPNLIYGFERQVGLSEKFDPCLENKEQENFVLNLDAKIMWTWGVFYCGGGQAVISYLRGISVDYKIDLHVDSYAW